MRVRTGCEIGFVGFERASGEFHPDLKIPPWIDRGCGGAQVLQEQSPGERGEVTSHGRAVRIGRADPGERDNKRLRIDDPERIGPWRSAPELHEDFPVEVADPLSAFMAFERRFEESIRFAGRDLAQAVEEGVEEG